VQRADVVHQRQAISARQRQRHQRQLVVGLRELRQRVGHVGGHRDLVAVVAQHALDEVGCGGVGCDDERPQARGRHQAEAPRRRGLGSPSNTKRAGPRMRTRSHGSPTVISSGPPGRSKRSGVWRGARPVTTAATPAAQGARAAGQRPARAALVDV
jgi:hypothetical protein